MTTDIIFLQKREGKSVAEMSDIPDWVHIGQTEDGLSINKYFEQHPDMVLGTVVEGNKLYGSGTMVVAEDGFDLKSALHEAVGKLSAEISHERGRDVYAKTTDGVQVQIPSNLRNYSFFLSDDQVFFKKNNAACEFRFDKGTAQHKRFTAFIELRDLTRELIEAMELDKPDSVTKVYRQSRMWHTNVFIRSSGLSTLRPTSVTLRKMFRIILSQDWKRAMIRLSSLKSPIFSQSGLSCRRRLWNTLTRHLNHSRSPLQKKHGLTLST